MKDSTQAIGLLTLMMTCKWYISLFKQAYSSVIRSPNIVWMIKSRRLRWAGHVARMEEGRSAFKILTGIPSGKRPRRRYEDNIKMGLKEIGI